MNPKQGSRSRSAGTRSLGLLLLEDHACGFVVGDAFGEFAQVFVAGGVELELLDGVFARVMQGDSIGGDRAVVGGEVGVERDRFGKLVDDVAGRQREVYSVAASLDGSQIDGPCAG